MKFFFLAGNISHRIERFNFGPRIYGLVTPLAGVEQISETGYIPANCYMLLFAFNVPFLQCG